MASENPNHGLPDQSIKEAHDFMHHADQEQHEHEAETKRGLPDSAIEAEHEFEDMVDHQGEQKKSKPIGEKVKETLDKILPGK